MKGFKGSVKKQRFLQQSWRLCLSQEEIALKAMENDISTLQDELCELHHEVTHAAEDIKNLRTELRDLQERDEAQVETIADLKAEKQATAAPSS